MPALSPYSTQVLATLHRLLPDLAALAIQEEESFLITTTSPSGFELWISSAEAEVTVGFAEHHTHFGWHEGDPLEDADSAAKYVQRLRTEQLVVTAWYEGTEFISSMTREASECTPAYLVSTLVASQAAPSSKVLGRVKDSQTPVPIRLHPLPPAHLLKARSSRARVSLRG